MRMRFFVTLLVLCWLVVPPTSAAGPGEPWQEYAGNPVLVPELPRRLGRLVHHVRQRIYDGGVYHMWYTGSRLTSSDQIGYATSPDGLHSANTAAAPCSAGAARKVGRRFGQPADRPQGRSRVEDVVHGFQIGPGSSGIGYATSPDGVNWTKSASNPVLTGSTGWEQSTVYRPSVVLRNGMYHMWYSTYGDALGYAHSTDGEHWTKSPSNPILQPGSPNAWDGEYVNAPTVLYLDGQYHMWYQGASSVSPAKFGHATATDPEHWTKDPANPVFRPRSAHDLGCLRDLLSVGRVQYGQIPHVVPRQGQFTNQYAAACGLRRGCAGEPAAEPPRLSACRLRASGHAAWRAH